MKATLYRWKPIETRKATLTLDEPNECDCRTGPRGSGTKRRTGAYAPVALVYLLVRLELTCIFQHKDSSSALIRLDREDTVSVDGVYTEAARSAEAQRIESIEME